MSKQNSTKAERQPRKQDDIIPIKKPKIEKDTPEDVVEPKQITDVNNDCLEHLLKYLSLADLLNVADSSKQLMDAAKFAFASNHGRKTIVLNSFPYPLLQTIAVHSDEIWIFDLPTCLRILRCFGSVIATLHVYYNFDDDLPRSKLDRYIQEYCAASLREIQFHKAPANAMKHLRQLEFPKVETVGFNDVSKRLAGNLLNVKKCFPNVRNLKLIKCNAALSNCISTKFIKLEHLSIHFDHMTGLNCMANCLLCLDLNPQLQSLHIAGDFDIDFLRSIRTHSTIQINCLSIKAHQRFFDRYDGDPVCFKTVTKFRLQCDDSSCFPARMPISFERLEEFTLDFVRLTIEENFVDFISKQKSLSQLVCHSNTVDIETKSKLADALPSVNILLLCNCEFSITEAINLLKTCRSLKKVNFKLAKQSKFKAMQKNLTAEWIGSADRIGCVQLERQI